MKAAMCVSLVFAALGWAAEPADRAAIGQVVAALNTYEAGGAHQRIAALFTEDADNQLHRLWDLYRCLGQSGDTPWSEMTRPRIVIQSVRLITPDVALVDAASTQYGSVIFVRRVPLLLVIRREAKSWRIASLRVLVNLPTFLGSANCLLTSYDSQGIRRMNDPE